MATPTEDLDFMGDIEVLANRGGHFKVSILLLVFLLFFAGLIWWGSWARIDIVTRGYGRVITSQQMQTVQNLEGGIISEIYVKAGDVVEKGQPLIQIDKTSLIASFNELELSRIYYYIEAKRLKSEISGTQLVYSEEIKQKYPDLVADQMALNLVRLQDIEGQLNIARQKELQFKYHEKELQVLVQKFRKMRSLVIEEIDIVQPNVDKGLTPRIEVLRLNQKLVALDKELAEIELKLPRTKSSINEYGLVIKNKKHKFQSEAQAKLNNILVGMKKVEEQLVADQDRVKRTQVLASVKGVINQLYVFTKGGVASPGMILMEIVPMDDTLLIQAQIRPQDIAFLRPGQEARVRLTAYNFFRYGALNGTVESISADTVINQEGFQVYEILVETGKLKLETENSLIDIIPGMVAEVDVITGERSVLEYIIVPLENMKRKAFRSP